MPPARSKCQHCGNDVTRPRQQGGIKPLDVRFTNFEDRKPLVSPDPIRASRTPVFAFIALIVFIFLAWFWIMGTG
jgi:hypothetical protein